MQNGSTKVGLVEPAAFLSAIIVVGTIVTPLVFNTRKVIIDVDDEKEIQEYDVKDLRFKPRRRKEKGKEKGKQKDDMDKELKELEALERKEGKASKLNED